MHLAVVEDEEATSLKVQNQPGRRRQVSLSSETSLNHVLHPALLEGSCPERGRGITVG